MGSVERQSRREWGVTIGSWLCVLLMLTGAGRAQAPVDLNRASVEELQRLPSIGPVLAQRIIDHRARHGPFRRAQEIVAVRGLSARRYRRIAHLITANPLAR